ncbi:MULTISPECIES: hypothetical protein [Pseudomonadota]|nr:MULTISPECIES: hypothetical protein [Pseudomonadota]
MEPFLGEIVGEDGKMTLAFRQWLAALADAIEVSAAKAEDHETRIAALEV